jgi:hypothetical protein
MIEAIVRCRWHNDEYWDDALCRGAVVAFVKLALWRKYPFIGRVRLLRIVSGARVELCAFTAYERGKFFTEFLSRALREFGVTKILMEPDKYGLPRL